MVFCSPLFVAAVAMRYQLLGNAVYDGSNQNFYLYASIQLYVFILLAHLFGYINRQYNLVGMVYLVNLNIYAIYTSIMIVVYYYNKFLCRTLHLIYIYRQCIYLHKISLVVQLPF